MAKFEIHHRKFVEVNTDPQRRCYNGAHFSSEWQWTQWEVLESSVSKDLLEERLAFWRDLNAYAVSQRGQSALYEFKAVLKVEQDAKT